MSTPGNYGVLSGGLPAPAQGPRRQRRHNPRQAFKRALRSILFLAVLSIVILGTIKVWGSVFGNVRAAGSPPDMSAGTDQAVTPVTTPPSTAPKEPPTPPTTKPTEPTKPVETPAVPANQNPPDVPAGAGDDQTKYTGILLLVNRTHPLPASYVPQLVAVNARLAPGITRDEKLMQPEAAKALESLMQKADQDHITLYCVSGYRSYATQKGLYDWRVEANGQAAADLYTARPGQSEHQTGMAMDLTNQEGAQGELSESFGQTAEGKWLANNAQNFGFILRYPAGREKTTGYNYEPWHIRYVGVTAAKAIQSQGLVLEDYLK